MMLTLTGDPSEMRLTHGGGKDDNSQHIHLLAAAWNALV